MPAHEEKVPVLGLGLMGSVLAKALVAKGYEVTVWNRSPEGCGVRGTRARRQLSPRCVLVEQGDCCLPPQLRGRSISDAIVRDRVSAVRESVDPVVDGITSRREGHVSLGEGGGVAYLDGAILGSPSMIGGDQAKVLVSGPQDVFDQNIELLEAFTRHPSFCGTEIGRAAALDHAALELSAGCAMVLFHAMALCAAESISFEDLFALATPFKDGTSNG